MICYLQSQGRLEDCFDHPSIIPSERRPGIKVVEG